MNLRFIETIYRTLHNKIGSKTGSAVAYLFLALFLIGALSVALVGDPGVGLSTAKLNQTKADLRSDIVVVTEGITECILVYSEAVDVDNDGDVDAADNPNPPYPVYGDNSTGGTGDDLADIKCPGSDEKIFTSAKGRFFKLLGDSKYTTTYMNDATDGVYFTIDYSLESENWDQSLIQIKAGLSACQVDIDDTTGTCATGSCLIYWVKRNSACP